MQVSALLRASSLARHELWALIEAATGQRREHWIAHLEEALPRGPQALLARWIDQRQKGVPLAYLVGWREFYSRRFWVNPHTLIPRPETELLIEIAINQIPRNAGSSAICELGTGSGCIAISLALARRDIRVVATDQSEAALAVARNNAAWLAGQSPLEFRRGSWCEALNAHERFLGLVSNPPYVARGDPHLTQGDLAYEPAAALSDQSEDGLGSIRAIAQQSQPFLEPGGFLLVEHGYDQQPAVADIFRQAGFQRVTGFKDMAQVPRAVLGFKP